MATTNSPVNHLVATSSSEKNASFPSKYFFFSFSFLVQTVPQTHLSSDYIKLCLCSGGVCVQAEIQAGQLCRSMEILSLIYIPNLSSPQHSLSLNRRAAWSLKHTKINISAWLSYFHYFVTSICTVLSAVKGLAPVISHIIVEFDCCGILFIWISI